MPTLGAFLQGYETARKGNLAEDQQSLATMLKLKQMQMEQANIAENRATRLQLGQETIADRAAGREVVAGVQREGLAQRAADAAAARQARMDELKMRLQDARLQGADRLAMQKEIAKLSADTRMDIATMQGQTQRELAAMRADKPMTEFQGKAALYGTRAAQSDKVLKALEDKVNLYGLSAGQKTGILGNMAMSSEQQRVNQAQRDFVNAVLRQESGAVISDQEFANAKQQYFPAPGDSKAVLDQKRDNRQLAIQGFARMSGSLGAADIKAIIDNPLLPGVSPTAETPQQNAGGGKYIEIRKTRDGKTLGKKADGTIEEIKP